MSCQYCNGTGMIEMNDNVDFGSITASLQTVEFCPDCICESICPGCGEKDTIPWNEETDEPAGKCEHCGWEWKGWWEGWDG